jgi:ribosomal protein S18 acetylase RimI-like enzyme
MDKLLAIGHESGLFSPEEIEILLTSSLKGVLNQELGPFHYARVAVHEEVPLGWTYLAPPSTSLNGINPLLLHPDVMEIFWIGVSSSAQRSGIGSLLIADCESLAFSIGAKKLKVCTSATDATKHARCFYEARGFVSRPEDVVANGYGPGDDLVAYYKALA